MSKKRAIKAISLLWIGSLLGAFFAFLTQVILARHLGVNNFGLFASAMATVTLVTPLAGFGVAQYWLKVFGSEGWHAARWVTPSFRFILVSTLLAMSILIIWALFGPHESEYRWLILILSFYIFGQVSIELVSSKLQLEERFITLSTWQLLPHLIRFVMIVILSYGFTSWVSVEAIALTYAAIAVVFTMVGIFHLGKLKKGRFDLKGHDFSSLGKVNENQNVLDVLSNTWPFGLAAFFQLIYFQSDIILVKYFIGDEAVGLYNVAFTVMAAVYLLPGVIYQKYLLPKMHRWANYDRAKFYQVYFQGNVAMLIIGTLAMISLWFISGWAIPLLFTDQYKGSVILLNMLAFSAPIIFIAFNAGSTLVTQEHMKRKVKYMGYVALINLVLNIIMIPLYGAMGAAFSTVLSNGILLLFYYLAAKRVVFLREYTSIKNAGN